MKKYLLQKKSIGSQVEANNFEGLYFCFIVSNGKIEASLGIELIWIQVCWNYGDLGNEHNLSLWLIPVKKLLWWHVGEDFWQLGKFYCIILDGRDFLYCLMSISTFSWSLREGTVDSKRELRNSFGFWTASEVSGAVSVVLYSGISLLVHCIILLE